MKRQPNILNSWAPGWSWREHLVCPFFVLALLEELGNLSAFLLYHTFMAVLQYNYESFGILCNKLKILASLSMVHSKVTCHVGREFLANVNEPAVKWLGSKNFKRS